MDLGKILLAGMSMPITEMRTSIGELQRDYLFKMEIIDAPDGYGASDFGLSDDSLDVYMTTGIFPERKTEQIQVKWAGSSCYYSGVDGSQKTGTLTFRMDEDMKIKDYLEALRDLTGARTTHAAMPKQNQVCQVGIGLVDVKKEIYTDYRILHNVIFWSVAGISPNKEGSAIMTMTADISWDDQEPDTGRIGGQI